MNHFYKILLVLALIWPTAALAAPSDADLKLKPGARGKLCQGCHIDFADTLQRGFVHTPVKKGDCSGCHNPHASDHGKLLAVSPGQVCAACHPGIIPEKAISIHQVAAEGNCQACHDPHASGHKNNLVKAEAELCFDCHKSMKGELAGLKTPHAPVKESCLECHNPHASKTGQSLLVSSTADLCNSCHETGGKKFSAAHQNYPLGQADCTSCHNPHGSNQRAMLYDQVHAPVAKRMCNQCHQEATAAKPLELKRSGFELCRGCHSDMVNDAFGKNRLHWPLASGNGCLDCHSPHASKTKNLLLGSELMVCGKCHTDTIKRQEQSPTKHQPVKDGECSACHDPHASNNNFLAKENSVIELCGTCHDWQKHSSHPLGADYRDKRNPNLDVDCLSCHRSHGTEFNQMIPFASVTSLCVQCHDNFKR